VPIGFDDIKAIQQAADRVVRGCSTASVTAEDRAKLRDLTSGSKRFSEGDLVVLVGFIVGKARANPGESANCYLRGTSNNDFEFWVAPSAGAKRFEGIIAEMIPQQRLTAWTLRKLRTLAADHSQVQVVGQLMLDTRHLPDPTGEISGESPRFSTWEIHPVTRLLVCQRGTGCDAARETDWQPLEAIPDR